MSPVLIVSCLIFFQWFRTKVTETKQIAALVSQQGIQILNGPSFVLNQLHDGPSRLQDWSGCNKKQWVHLCVADGVMGRWRGCTVALEPRGSRGCCEPLQRTASGHTLGNYAGC